VAAGGIGALIYALDVSVKANELVARPPNFPWEFNGPISTFDHAR
jgi:hypothetical protein